APTLNKHQGHWDNIDPLWLGLSIQMTQRTRTARHNCETHTKIGSLPKTCQWITDDAWFAGLADRHKCAKDCMEGKPYCPLHYQMSIQKKR
ncbi:MAG: hypothetical protein AAF352_05860, partial [Pseudomonadota bacterium]